MDVDDNGVLNYSDLFAFIEVYNKTCTDPPPPIAGCQGKDVRVDGVYNNKIDYMDLDSFLKRYSGSLEYDKKNVNCYLGTTPTNTPVITETVKPTVTPENKPTVTSTIKPTVTPTIRPSSTPTNMPINTPTVTPIMTTPPLQEGVLCGPLDVNGDNKINWIDRADFETKWLKHCIDTVDYSWGCGAKDFNHDGVIEYKDWDNYYYYESKNNRCI
jgi:hypothetical protein